MYLAGLDLQFLRSEQVWAALPGNAEKEKKNTFVCQLFFIGDSEGTADYVISITESWMTPTILMTLTFVVSAFIAFFTGTSWGTYAIVTPICVQMALNISGGALTPVVYLQ